MTGLVWIYGVTSARDLPGTGGLAGVAGERVRLVAEDRLAAAVGTVPEDDFAEEPLTQHLEDLRWLEGAARAHHRVIDTLFRHGDTVPLQFATVYHDDDSVRAVLRERADDFTAALGRVRGRAEWGVKASMDPASASGSDDGGGDGPAGADSRPGTAYLLRRRARQDEREQAFVRAQRCGADLRRALEGVAVRVAPHPPQDQRLAGYDGWMILNDSFLVDRDRAGDFAAAVRACGERFPDVEVELSGPWPPYSFVAEAEQPRESGDGDAWAPADGEPRA